MKEIEFKYNASNISIETFQRFCGSKKPSAFKNIAGYDYFYKNGLSEDAFFRHRVGPDMNQLTFKKKTDPNNNFVRVEHNIDLGPNMSRELINSFCKDMGYYYTKPLFKNSFIYTYEGHVLVYYVCYDKNMIELGRFIEIEIDEEYASSNEKGAWEDLKSIEKLCKPLGLSPNMRVTASLAEMYG